MISSDHSQPIPYLEVSGKRQRLVVDGQPFLVLGGEFHNSATSTSAAVQTAFASIRDRNFNAVLAPVAWGTLEPREGEFDFGLVDRMLVEARSLGVRLILLWFGTWKNGVSTYVPQWVRVDRDRFPRAKVEGGAHCEHISPFGTAIAEADGRAFATLMAHLREADFQDRTVIMVQVENEVGILGDSRDRSALAESRFARPVPEEVFEAIEASPSLALAEAWERHGKRRDGDWTSVFGTGSSVDEAFMATAYAAHLQSVVVAGKAEYALPMFANAWLYTDVEVSDPTVAGGQEPGVYPSGGPVPRVAGLWRKCAPSLDLLAPDIYFGDFERTCREYVDACSGLFIPEMRRDDVGAGDAFLAVGNHGAIGVSPFGIDSASDVDASAFRDAYRLLRSLGPLIGRHETVGVHLDDARPVARRPVGDFIVEARRQPIGNSNETVERGYGLIVLTGTDEIIAVGRGLHLQIRTPSGAHVELLRAEELEGQFPEFTVGRLLNGDETHSGSTIILHASASPVAASYQIPTSKPGNGVVRCRLYLPR